LRAVHVSRTRVLTLAAVVVLLVGAISVTIALTDAKPRRPLSGTRTGCRHQGTPPGPSSTPTATTSGCGTTSATDATPSSRGELEQDRRGLAHPGGCGRRAGLGCADRLHRGAGPPARRRRQEKANSPIQATRQQALGRSRGGLTTKLHTICDGRGRNLATRITPGQDADTLELVTLVDQVRVARPGGRSRARTHLEHLTGDKAAYSTRANAGRAASLPHPAHHSRA
jgi:hypothetical protein